MATVREVVYDMLRDRGMTAMFGNPGSTELTFLADFPDDFTYVLGLHEMVAVGMADGYAQASGRPAHVNLHTAPGVGNGVGAIFNAQANHSPILITAGNQTRALMSIQANLSHPEATVTPQPFVKFAYEPTRAEDVPLAIGRAIALADLAPKGPTYVSIPMDDWEAEAIAEDVKHHTARKVSGRAAPDPEALAEIAARLRDASNPVLVVGPGVDQAGGWDAVVRLAENQRLPVFATSVTGGARVGFPENHPLFRGVLPPAIGPVGQTLAGYDLVVVLGSNVFPYYPNIPGPLLAEGTSLIAITSDPFEAARAPMGDALVADVALAAEALADAAGQADREAPEPLPAPEPDGSTDPMTQSSAADVLGAVIPDEGIIVMESPSSTMAVRNRARRARPGSYFFSAGGGLGWGLPAALGVQMAQPDRPVVAVLGEGSAQYAITGLWTAVAYELPVTFLVMRNDDYSILKAFAAMHAVENAPGLDLPGLDCVALAQAYGMKAGRVSGPDELEAALKEGIAGSEPRLIEVKVEPGLSVG